MRVGRFWFRLPVVEGPLPLRDLRPRFVDDEDPVVGAVVAVLSDHPLQTLALAAVLGTRPAHGELRVAAARLAAELAEVPVAGRALVALLARDARLAAALTRVQVALGRV